MKLYKFLHYAFSFLPLIGYIGTIIIALIAVTTTSDNIVISKWTLYLVAALSTSLLLDYANQKFFIQKSITHEIKNGFHKWSKLSLTGLEDASTGNMRIDAFERSADKAIKSLFRSGTAMIHVSRGALDAITNALEKKCEVRILMLDPDYLENNPGFITAIEKTLNRNDFLLDVRSGVKSFTRYYENLSPELKENFHLRVYSCLPTINFSIIDPGSDLSEMIIELFPYKCGFNRPRLTIRPSTQEGWYSKLINNFERLWEESRVIF